MSCEDRRSKIEDRLDAGMDDPQVRVGAGMALQTLRS